VGDRVVIMGLGNLLLTDDGAGVAALHLLARTRRLPANVQLVDGGTLGLALLDYFDPDSDLILIDAVRTDAPPGTVVLFEGDDVAEAVGTRLSPHQVGVADLLQAAEHTGLTPRRTVLVGVVPESLGLGIARTPAVEASLPAMVDTVMSLVGDTGEERHAYVGMDVARALGL